MTIEETIKKAVEGGYKFKNVAGFTDLCGLREALLDPLFWQSLGKALGWGTYDTGIVSSTICG